MNNNFHILNIRFPFNEAVEFLSTENDVIACTCQEKTCTVTLSENNELKVIDYDFCNNCGTMLERTLNINNILNDEYYLVIKL